MFDCLIICCTEIESEVDRLTRKVSGYERVGQSTPKYMATCERQPVGFPVDSRQSRERASARRESTEVDRIEVEIEKLREQLGQYEELRSMQEGGYREREGSPAVRFKEPLYDNYVPPGVAVRQKSDRTKKPAQPAAAKGSNTARVKAATYDGTSSWLDYKSHFDACSRINQWSENEKGLYLAVALRGQAQGILGYVPIDKQQDYKSLVKALERFAPPNQTELYRSQQKAYLNLVRQIED